MFPEHSNSPDQPKTIGYQGENIADEDTQTGEKTERHFPDAGGLWTNGHGDVMVYPPTLV